MKAIVYSLQKFEQPYFSEWNKKFNFDISFSDLNLCAETAHLASGHQTVCIFTHDHADAQVMEIFQKLGVKLIALRCAGFNNVDIKAAAEHGIKVVRVPQYSPYAIAEHAVALILALDRKLCRAVSRVRELNFSLDGLVGFDLHEKTVGIIGAGRIGTALVKIMQGFGCNVLLYDLKTDRELLARGAQYVDLDNILSRSDIISLHLPLSDSTRHIIDEAAIAKMKQGVMLINTSRGGLIDARALIAGLKTGKIGSAGLDVYEEEEHIFFQDLSSSMLQDDILARLMTFPQVLITAHQAFLTNEALRNIMATTFSNLEAFSRGKKLENEILAP